MREKVTSARVISLFALLAACSCFVDSVGSISAQEPSETEPWEKIVEARATSPERYSMVSEVIIEVEFGRPYKKVTQLIRDGEKVDYRSESFLGKSGGGFKQNVNSAQRLLWDGQLWVKGLSDQSSFRGFPNISVGERRFWADMHSGKGNTGQALDGVMHGDYSTVWDIISDSGVTPSISDETEEIDGFACLVIEARTPRGIYILWLDPKEEYSIRKVEITRTGNDKMWIDKLVGTRATPEMHYNTTIKSIRTTLYNVSIDRIQGHSILVAGSIITVSTYVDGRRKDTRTDITRRDVDFDPDFEAMGAFVFSIPDGTEVRMIDRGPSGHTYPWPKGIMMPVGTWRDGKLPPLGG